MYGLRQNISEIKISRRLIILDVFLNNSPNVNFSAPGSPPLFKETVATGFGAITDYFGKKSEPFILAADKLCIAPNSQRRSASHSKSEADLVDGLLQYWKSGKERNIRSESSSDRILV